MTIYRTYNPTLHDQIANDPEVRQTFGIHLTDPSPIIFGPCAARANDFILLTNDVDACAMFEAHGPSVYEGHSLFAPTCRGRKAIKTGKLFLDWMWDNTQARIITGATPVELRGARWFNRQLGFQSDGIHHLNGQWGSFDCEWFRMDRPTLT